MTTAGMRQMSALKITSTVSLYWCNHNLVIGVLNNTALCNYLHNRNMTFELVVFVVIPGALMQFCIR